MISSPFRTDNTSDGCQINDSFVGWARILCRMCRYLQHPVRTHWACLPCRYTTKCRGVGVCTLCRQPMVDLGRDFRAPRHEDIRQWRKIALLFEHGIRFDSCGCSGPGPRPHTLADARAQFALRRQRRRDQPSEPGPFARRRKSGRITPVFR